MSKIFDKIKFYISELFRSRVIILIIVFCLMFSILIGRLFSLQIVNGQQYLDDYKLKIQKTRVTEGTRGNIYDRNGTLLAYNTLAYSVTIEDNYTGDVKEKNKELNKEIQQIIQIVEENGDTMIHNFNIILQDDEYAFAMENETLRLRFIADVYGFSTIDKLSKKQQNQSAADIIHYLCTDKVYGYGIDETEYDKEYVLKLVTIRYAMSLNRFQKYIPTTIAENVSDKTVAAILEQISDLPGVEIAEDSQRKYTDSKYYANIIGYTGQISQDEYDALSEKDKKRYSLTDTVGKSGLEKVYESALQGKKGEEKLYVNSVGKIIESHIVTEAQPGNDVYLTIDAGLQKAAYDLLEQELAGILLAKMGDVLDYDRSKCTDAGDVIVASGDMYYQFIGNNIIDMKAFSKSDAGSTEKAVYSAFSNYKESVLGQLQSIMESPDSPAYKEYPREYQAYLSYIVNDLLTSTYQILMYDSIDKSDETYLKWKKDETININQYLNYAVSQNWIDSSKLTDYLEGKDEYSAASEIYQGIVSFVIKSLSSDSAFDKLIYKYMIKAGSITGQQISLILFEQEVLPYNESDYSALSSGALSSYDFIRSKIQTLEITPGQLGLEPCTGSVVITDPNNGNVLACVSYPGYDNNRLANAMDSTYYNQLLTDSSRPLYNNATQEKTAPGSTFKPLSAIAGLTEGVISGNTYTTCEGIYTGIEPNIKCWIYPDTHDTLDVVGAITNSCNVFFNDLGKRLGMVETDKLDENGNKVYAYSTEAGLEKLEKYAFEFGLGEPAGLEIPESDPQISDQDSIRSAMGQGTNNFTTAQLARYISAVGNKGTVYDLTLLDRIESLDGTTLEEQEPKIHNTVEGVSSSTWNMVHEGMRGVITNNYTFFDKLNTSGIELAGKTGTAQQSTTHPDHGLFVCFAPMDNPEISMAIRIANGYSSTFAAEVGAGVMEYYYKLTNTEQLFTGNAASVTITSHGD